MTSTALSWKISSKMRAVGLQDAVRLVKFAAVCWTMDGGHCLLCHFCRAIYCFPLMVFTDGQEVKIVLDQYAGMNFWSSFYALCGLPLQVKHDATGQNGCILSNVEAMFESYSSYLVVHP